MSFYISQSGFEGVWKPNATETTRHLRGLFGFGSDKLVRVFEEIDKMKVGDCLKHEDLSLTISKH